jgi:hypothetical protein
MSSPAAPSGSWKTERYRALGDAARRAHADAEAERDRQRALPPPASEEEALCRALQVAGPFGLTLADCREVLGQCRRSRREKAIAAVRAASWVAEMREIRPAAGGTYRRQVVLRTGEAAEAYSGYLGSLSSFTTPPALQKAGPVTGPALRRARPGQPSHSAGPFG